MKRNLLNLTRTSLFLILGLMFFSCATTVNVQLTRPAELDLNGARTVSILPIKPYAYYKNSGSSIGQQILIATFYQIFDIKDSDEQLAINTLQSQLERGLIDSPYIKLVSADAVQSAIKNGTLNPADVYLTGEISYYNVDDQRRSERKQVKAATEDEPAEYTIVDRWTRYVYLNFKYQVVDSSTNKIIAYDQYDIKRNSSDYESKRDLPTAYSLIDSEVKYAANKILKELQPYVITKSITLLETKTKDKEIKAQMKAADELAKNSLLEKASEEFSRIYKETDLVEAGYNAAILQEALGNLSVAERMMLEVYENHPDSRVSKGLSDIRYEINQANRLKKQIKAATSDSEDLDDLDF